MTVDRYDYSKDLGHMRKTDRGSFVAYGDHAATAIKAQVTGIALSEIYTVLGVEDQTAAMAELKALTGGVGTNLDRSLRDTARSLLSLPPELRGPWKHDEENLKHFAKQGTKHMKRIEVYKCDNGLLESDIKRAAALNLHYRLPKGVNVNDKVLTFSECLTVIKYRQTIERIFAEMDAEIPLDTKDETR